MGKYQIWFECEDNEGNTDDYSIIIEFNNKDIEKFCTENDTVKNIKNQIIKCYKQVHEKLYDVYDIDEYCQFSKVDNTVLSNIIINNND